MVGDWILEGWDGVFGSLDVLVDIYREMFGEEHRPRTASVSVLRALVRSGLCQTGLSGPL